MEEPAAETLHSSVISVRNSDSPAGLKSRVRWTLVLCYLHVCGVLQLLHQLHRGVQVRSDRIHRAFLLRGNLLHLNTQSSVTSLKGCQTLQQLNGVPLKHTHLRSYLSLMEVQKSHKLVYTHNTNSDMSNNSWPGFLQLSL